MPAIKQLTCTIELGGGLPLAEYGTAYTDGFVQTYVATPPDSRPFSVHLLSDGYIAPGLAMFVYMDGIYQCNRNRLNLKLPCDATARYQYEIDLRVRQKEEKLQDGTWYGKEWRFEKLNIGSGGAQQTAIAASNSSHLGTIEVVVLRCHADPKAAFNSSSVHYSLSPDTSNYSATDMSVKPLGETPPASPPTQHQSPSSPISSSSSAGSGVVGLGIFDGACYKVEELGAYDALPGDPIIGLDGNWDDPHPPGPNGRPRKEWTWSVKDNEGVYHRIGEQPFRSEEPKRRVEGSHRGYSPPHFGHDWEVEARRDERSRDRRSWHRSPSRTSFRRRDTSPQGRPSSHRGSVDKWVQAPPDSHRGGHAGDNDVSTGWAGVPTAGPAPAIVIQVQQAPLVARSIHSRGRSQSREQKPSSRANNWPSPPPWSIGSGGTRQTLMTPSEIEQQEIRYGFRPSRASHAHTRASDIGGLADYQQKGVPSSVRSHRSSRSHQSNKMSSHQRDGNDWHRKNHSDKGTGEVVGWGGDNRNNNAHSWGGNHNNNNPRGDNGWDNNNEGGDTSGGGWGNGDGGDNDAGNGQNWGANTGFNAAQSMPGSWGNTHAQGNSGANAPSNDQEPSCWAHNNNENANNTTQDAWNGGINTASNVNQWSVSTSNANPPADNNDTSCGLKAGTNVDNDQVWNSGTTAAHPWRQKPSPNSGNGNWNNGNNNDNDNSASGKSTWAQKPSTYAGNDKYNPGSNYQAAEATAAAPNSIASTDWAANIRKLFANGNDQAMGSKPDAAPLQQTFPVHGFYSLPNSPVPTPQTSPPQPALSHRASPPQSQQPSLQASVSDPAKATFATIKPYWAKWHDAQTLTADHSATDEPYYTVTKEFLNQTSTSHQVKPGKPAVYSHRIHRPVYIDKHDEPYAVFLFKYRSKEVLEQILGSSLTDSFDDVKSKLGSLSKEELLEELIRVKTAPPSDKTVSIGTEPKEAAVATNAWINSTHAPAKPVTVSLESTNQSYKANENGWNTNNTPAANNEPGEKQPAQDRNHAANSWQNNSTAVPTWSQPAQPIWQTPVWTDHNPAQNVQAANNNDEMSPQDYENYVSGGTDWIKNHPAAKSANNDEINNNTYHNGNGKTHSWTQHLNNPPSPTSLDLAFAKAKEWKPYVPQISPFSSVKDGETGNAGTGWGGGQKNSPVAMGDGGAWGGNGENGDGAGNWEGAKQNSQVANNGGEWAASGGTTAAPGGGW
ncbi:MAG: hypothetical protein M1836_001488 [Candelina mexicana]|nr:MAG: hypothetical protein M1836_001488 [Candelina mexicana]